MPEIENDKDKTPKGNQTHSTSEKQSENPKEKQEKPAAAAPQKSVWDLPDGEFTEVFDSEGHRNRINHY